MEALLVWGTEEQKQKFLVPMLKGEAICYQNLTEPQAGTDLANVKNTAVRDGDDWILDGTNVFIGGPFQPQMIFGPYLTDPEAPRHRNLGYFVVTAPTPGLVLNEMNLVSDERKQAVFLDNVRVPADHLIGGDHQGWQVLATHLEIEHGGRGQARMRDPLVDDLVDFTKETKHDGESRLGSDPVVQQATMETYIESHVHNLLGLRTAWMYQNRMQIQTEGNVHNVHGRLSGLRNAVRVRDVMGMYAFVDDRDPRAYQGGRQEIRQRAAVGQRHGQGTTNIARLILARRMGISRTQERAAPTAASSTSDS
jgi:alkylation response protein AidB-like acyl-CoA dehydrogenase